MADNISAGTSREEQSRVKTMLSAAKTRRRYTLACKCKIEFEAGASSSDGVASASPVMNC